MLAEHVERFTGEDGQCCRVLIGMHATPDDELRAALRTLDTDDGLDNARMKRLTRHVAQEFRAQLTVGAPTNADEAAFTRRNLPPRSLHAFEASDHADDWRELMRLFLVRRTRSFIKANYAERDHERRFLQSTGGERYYLPKRMPRTLPLPPTGADDPYSRLYDISVVDTNNGLSLPRYGLANYLRSNAGKFATGSVQHDESLCSTHLIA